MNISARAAEIRTRAGDVRRIDLADLEKAAEVRAALQEAHRRTLAAAVAEQPQPR